MLTDMNLVIDTSEQINEMNIEEDLEPNHQEYRVHTGPKTKTGQKQ